MLGVNTQFASYEEFAEALKAQKAIMDEHQRSIDTPGLLTGQDAVKATQRRDNAAAARWGRRSDETNRINAEITAQKKAGTFDPSSVIKVDNSVKGAGRISNPLLHRRKGIGPHNTSEASEDE